MNNIKHITSDNIQIDVIDWCLAQSVYLDLLTFCENFNPSRQIRMF